ncbi:Sel1 repeat-containing protein [Balamuthia mandrillaris]
MEQHAQGLRASGRARAEAFLETDLNFAQLVELAERGEAQAQYLLARCYAKGLGGAEESEKEALLWYTTAAQQEHPMAQYKLGRCLFLGRGVEKNRSEALQWYLKASHHRHCKAQYRVAMAYALGYGVAPDKQEAVRWHRTAAEGGCPYAQNSLAVCLSRGDGVEKDDKEAFKWFQAAAKQGHARAQYNLALCYQQGDGVEVQWKEAVSWHRAAMAQGHVKAKFELAKRLFKGKGTKGDPEQALQYLQELSETGFVPAMYTLARLVEQVGWQTKDDDVLKIAARWHCMSLREHYPVAKARLPLPTNTRLSSLGWKAIFWYLKATKAGDASAQFNLALAFSRGESYFATANHEEAGKWFLAAAKQHHARAQYFMGRRLAAEGKEEEAMEWFLASARQHLPQAQFQVGLHLCGATNNNEEQQGVEYCNQAAKARNPPALLWMAKHWRAKGQFVKARKCLDRLRDATHIGPEVRYDGETVLREMNRNKEGMPVRSLLEASKMAVARQVMQTWERYTAKMKGGMPTELWQGLEPFLPVLVMQQNEENERMEEEEEGYWHSQENLFEEEQEIANERIEEDGEEDEGDDPCSDDWIPNLFKKEKVLAFLSTAHFGLQCDGCGASPIQGVRYKCGHCPDFDLCSKCEPETKHDEGHVFLMIKRPLHDTLDGPLLPNFYGM